jgi:hypothetical protein
MLAVVVFALVGLTFWLVGQRLPEAIFQRLDRGATAMGFFVTCLTISLATVGWFRRQDLRRWLRHSHFESVGAPFKIPEEKVDSIVIPVSRREQPEWILKWLKPNYASFIYTGQSRADAVQLAKDFAESTTFFPSVEDIEEGLYQLNHPDDPEESKRLVTEFLHRFLNRGTRLREIFVDTTGGKVPMSIGAFQAAEEMGVSSIYVVGTANGLIRNPQDRNDGQPVFMSDHSTT